MSSLKDPVRLVLDPSCPDGQRELLRHGASLEPPRDAEGVVWQALVGTLGAAAVGDAADASGKTTTPANATKAVGATTQTLVAVVLALGALTGVVALGAHFVAATKAPPPVSKASPPVAAPQPPAPRAPAWAPPPEPTAVEKSPWEHAPPPVTNRAQPAAGSPKSVRAKRQPAGAAATPSPDTRSGDETASIEEARLALRSGDPARALRLLEECRRRFPAGVLGQERELLTIQALVSAVRGRETRERAAAFLRKYPRSPHAGEIRALGLGAPEGR
jgi:hypothetical protein